MNTTNNLEIIRTCLELPNNLSRIALESFTPHQQRIVNTLKSQLSITPKPTLRSAIRSILDGETKQEVIHEYQHITREIGSLEPLDQASFDVALVKNYTEAKLELHRQIVSITQLDPNDTKNVQKLERRIQQIIDQTQIRSRHLPISSDDYEAIEEHEVECLKTHIEWLESHDVHFRKGDLHALIATTNGGKTVVSTWIATQLVKGGYNVLYLSQEESPSDTHKRHHYSLLHMSRHEYEQLPSESVKTRFDMYKGTSNYGKFYVAEWPGISVEDLQLEVDNCETIFDTVFDAVFIDYSRHLTSRKKSNSNWESVANIFEKLKIWASDSKKVIFTAIQLNREASDKIMNGEGKIRTTNVAGAYEATMWCQMLLGVIRHDNPLAMQTHPEDRNHDFIRGRFNMQIVKLKHGNLTEGDEHDFQWTESMNLVDPPQQGNLDINDQIANTYDAF